MINKLGIKFGISYSDFVSESKGIESKFINNNDKTNKKISKLIFRTWQLDLGIFIYYNNNYYSILYL